METQPTTEETASGYYVWSVPGNNVTVHLSLDVVDRLSLEVLTGFGAIPKRGAEVGGILTGTIQGKTVRIEDFIPVPCEYKRGPSYLLSEADAAAFDHAYQEVRPSSGLPNYAVGYYRSNTRDQTAIAEEDRKLCKRYFPGAFNVMLLVKPYASKVSTAGFLTYGENGLEAEPALEFPFRRHELEGTAPPSRRPLAERESTLPVPDSPAAEPAQDPPPRPQRRVYIPHSEREAASPTPISSPGDVARPSALAAESNAARSRGWLWIPLSFIFLFLGVLLGFQAALTIYPKGGAPLEDPYALSLTIAQTGDNLHLKWNRRAQAVRTARRSMLEITDGNFTKKVELDASQLQNGSVIYRHLSNKVHFRMEVYPRDQTIVTESAEWQLKP